MALGVVVVEAAARSGSLITARMAAEQRRHVFAVPGSPIDPRSGGTNDLLKKGAILVTEARDVLEALERAGPPGPDDDLAEPDTLHLADGDPPEDLRAHLAELIGPVAVTIDDLARLSGAPVSLVRVVLVELELAGRVRRDEAGAVMLA
jgi:DNA processing protein